MKFLVDKDGLRHAARFLGVSVWTGADLYVAACRLVAAVDTALVDDEGLVTCLSCRERPVGRVRIAGEFTEAEAQKPGFFPEED